MSTMVEYARRVILADKLISSGCKWPIVKDLLQIRPVDAQRIAHQRCSDRRYLSRIEKGMYWWRTPGQYNIRMVHANFMFRIYRKYSDKYLEAEKLLYTFTTYSELIEKPVIDNINRAYYLLNSIICKKGFVFRLCPDCEQKYIAIGLIETDKCFSCERNQYMRCVDCETALDKPYNPGTNGNKKKRCTQCMSEVRKKQRILKRLQKANYLSEHKLY